MEWIHGVKVNDARALRRLRISPHAVGYQVMRRAECDKRMRCVFVDGCGRARASRRGCVLLRARPRAGGPAAPTALSHKPRHPSPRSKLNPHPPLKLKTFEFEFKKQQLERAFAEMTFVHGYLHADPHPGNILVRPSGRRSLASYVATGSWQPFQVR